MSKKEAFADLARSGRSGYSVIDTVLDKIETLEQQLAAKDAEIERLRTAFNVWSNSDECQKNDVLLCLAFKEK